MSKTDHQGAISCLDQRTSQGLQFSSSFSEAVHGSTKAGLLLAATERQGGGNTSKPPGVRAVKGGGRRGEGAPPTGGGGGGGGGAHAGTPG
jgi:hypothetical protein